MNNETDVSLIDMIFMVIMVLVTYKDTRAKGEPYAQMSWWLKFMQFA